MHEMTKNDNQASMHGYVSYFVNFLHQKLLSNAKKLFI